VLAWAGFVDFLHHHLAVDGLKAIDATRPEWKLKTAEDLREYADHQVIEAGKAAGFYPKSVMKALHGLLNKRNESAHPSEYFPDFNETLGYVSELSSGSPTSRQERPHSLPDASGQGLFQIGRWTSIGLRSGAYRVHFGI
jgi:hypothetical protein